MNRHNSNIHYLPFRSVKSENKYIVHKVDVDDAYLIGTFTSSLPKGYHLKGWLLVLFLPIKTEVF